MTWRYDLVCPVCGYSESRLDSDTTCWRTAEGVPPTEFGEAVRYRSHIVKDGEIIPTGRIEHTTPVCPECRYGAKEITDA